MSASRVPLIPADDLKQHANLRTGVPLKIDTRGLEEELHRSVEGEVRFDAGSRGLYAVDASNYRQVPIGVVVPRSVEDVIHTVAACRYFGAPVLSRGGGTSLAGQCCNVAIVMDWTKYLHNIVELNISERYARLQPGTICDRLRHAAQPYKLTWGPDPATHTHCTFGGMLGNNSCGAHAQMAGKAADNVEAMDILLYDGTRLTVGWMNHLELLSAAQQPGRIGEIYTRLKSLRDAYGDLIQRNYPKIPRRVSGYNLDQLLPGPDGRFNVARALVGSEGTCVTILEAKVRLVPSRPGRVLLVLGYPEVYQAGDHVPDVLEFSPVALEGMDEFLIDGMKKKGGPYVDYLRMLPEGRGWLLVELGQETQEQALEQAHELIAKLKDQANAPTMKVFRSDQDQQKIWQIREGGLGATAFVPGEPVAWEGWEDSAVAPDRVGAYLRALCKLYEKYSYRSAMYGHFGQGCIHCRINFDLQSAPGIKKWREFMGEATDLVVSFGGSISGEHGDGQSKAEFLYKMFGPELIQAFREFKSIWDPEWKMNPGKVIEPYSIDQNLRLGAAYKPWQPSTHFKFPDDSGSFANAALRCVGVGKCRRWSGEGEQDTMCPSYMVTLEEEHSTRGRAHLLWEMLHGDVIKSGWRDKNVKEALDLCLACKGCKGDCPVNVDIATYKAEFLSHYWAGRIRPRHAYAFGLIDQWARLAAIAPGFANLFTQLPGIRELAKLAAGMPHERQIPAFASETFQDWFRRRGARNPNRSRVILWPDTFNNYFKPETAKAAVEVLEASGFQVVVPQAHLCCGRPLYDYGFLTKAKRYLDRTLRVLAHEIDAGTPMVVLEPSCCSVFRDELTGLMPEVQRAQALKQRTFTLAEFLAKEANSFSPPKLNRKAIVQAHCHHKAIMRLKEEKQWLDQLGLDYEVLESGCCGMAGSFGYEKDKYEVSVRAGERVLLPEVRKAARSTFVVADGFSCKEQIEQQSGRRGLHLAEVLSIAMREQANKALIDYPENASVMPRLKQTRNSMWRAGLITGAALLSVITLGSLVRRAHR